MKLQPLPCRRSSFKCFRNDKGRSKTATTGFVFRIFLSEFNPQNKTPVSECFAFLTYFILLSSCFVHLFLIVLNLILCEQVGCQSPTTNATRSKMLRILVNFDSLSSFYVGTSCLCSLLSLFVLRFSLVGSAHTRTLFEKSVAKTFVFFSALYYN